MNHRHVRTNALLALAVATAAVVGPWLTPLQAHAVPQDACAGSFCATFDLGTYDAASPTQATTAAAQPTNLSVRFAAKAPSTSDKSTWLSKVSAVLGTSSSKAFAVTDPATLPLGSYVAGSAASAGSCAPGTDGSGYATTCPAGHGTGLVSVTGLTGTETKPATFGVKSITTGVGGAMTATIGVFIPGALVPVETTTTVPVTYTPATATSGPTLTMSTTPAITPLGYLSADASLNDVQLTFNGLVGSTPFVRQSTLCTTVTSTLVAQARSTATASSPFQQTITGCPAAPALVSVVPVAGNPLAFTFTVQPPAAAVAGRTAQVEWVFGDGSKTVAGASTTHAYPTINPVTGLATVVDSAGARSTSVQVRIAGDRVRAKQAAGNRLAGVVADQDTGQGIPDQQVDAYRCPTRGAPVSRCEQVGTTTTRADGGYRIRIPEVTKRGVAMVLYGGGASQSAAVPARFGAVRYLTVLPQPDVSLHLSKKRVHPGATVRLSGKVEPVKKGKTVRLQGFLRGKWRSIGKTTVGDSGRFAASYVVRAPGQPKVKVRALLPGTSATLEATSPVKVIRIGR